MQPTLEPGDRVLVRRLGRKLSPSLGSVVVTWHPQRSKLRLIKRLKSVEETGLWLLGDNPTESTDSRQLGAVPTNLLIGEVVGRLPRGDQNRAGEVFCSQMAPVMIERAPVPPTMKGISRAPLRRVRNDTTDTTATMAPMDPSR